MKSLVLILLLFACSSQQIVEPEFCWTCYESNVGGTKYNMMFGNGTVKKCGKTESEINHDEDFEYWSIENGDSTYHYHSITCTKDLEHVN